MATRIGELQAKLLQPDSLDRLVSSLLGARPDTPTKGQGIPFVPAPMDVDELQREMDRLATAVENEN